MVPPRIPLEISSGIHSEIAQWITSGILLKIISEIPLAAFSDIFQQFIQKFLKVLLHFFRNSFRSFFRDSIGISHKNISWSFFRNCSTAGCVEFHQEIPKEFLQIFLWKFFWEIGNGWVLIRWLIIGETNELPLAYLKSSNKAVIGISETFVFLFKVQV